MSTEEEKQVFKQKISDLKQELSNFNIQTKIIDEYYETKEKNLEIMINNQNTIIKQYNIAIGILATALSCQIYDIVKTIILPIWYKK